MTSQLVVGPHSSSSLLKSDSSFTVDNINTNGLNIGSTISINGDLNVTGEYQLDGNTVLIGNTLGSGVTISNLEIVGNLESLNILGDLNVDSTTLVVDSSNNNVGISTNPNSNFTLDINGNTNITGDLVVQGITALNGITTIVSSTTAINETFLKLAITNPTDLVDTGVYNMYQDSGVTKFAGYFRDATDKKFKFFENLEIEPTTIVDISTTSFRLGDLLVDELESSTLNISTTSSLNQLSVSGIADFSNDVYIDNNLGIGTTGPNYQLDVSGDINTRFGKYRINNNEVLSEDTLGNGITSSNLQELGVLNTLNVTGDSIFDTDTLYVSSSSNRIGIGTTNPLFKLSVSGDINTTTNYKINGLEVLNDNSLGNGVTSSNLQELGILNSLNVTGDVNLDGNTFFINSSNNRVGIGTTTPDVSLHILEDSIVNELQLKIENTNSLGAAGLEINNNGLGNLTIKQNNDSSIFQNDGGNILFLARDTGNIDFFTTDSNTRRFRIQNDGNVAIGLSNGASFNLDVNDDINTGIAYYITGVRKMDITGITSNIYHFNDVTRIEENSNIDIFVSGSQTRFNTNGDLMLFDGNLAVGITSPSLPISIGVTNTGLGTTGSELGLYTEGFERIRIDDSGLVGVGNSNPLFNLDVFGSINFTGQLFQNGSAFLVPDGLWTQQNGDIYLTGFGQVAIGTSFTQNKLLIHQTDSTESYAQFTNTTTGITGTDGLLVGIDSSENSVIRNQENTDLIIYTNDTERIRIENDGIIDINDNTLTNVTDIENDGGINIRTTTGNAISLQTNNTERMRIINTGPINVLETMRLNTILDGSASYASLIITQESNNNDNITFRKNINTNNIGIGFQNSGGFLSAFMGENGQGELTFRVGGVDESTNNFSNLTERLRIIDGGDIDINNGDLDLNNNNITNVDTITATTLNGTISTSSQPNITSLGTLTSLDMSGNIDLNTNNITDVGTLTATTLNGTIGTASQPNITSLGTLTSLDMGGDIDMNDNTISNASDIENNGTINIRTTTGNAISLQTNSTERMRIINTGQINVLTQMRLNTVVDGSPSFSALLITQESDNTDNITFRKSANTNNLGVGFTNGNGFLSAFMGENGTGELTFRVGSLNENSNNFSNLTERLRIINGGNIDINNGDLDLNSNNITNVGTITATTLNGTISTSSQPNITSLGTLTSLDMSGNIDLNTNNITDVTTLTATTLNGTIGTNSQPNITSLGTLTSLDVSDDIILNKGDSTGIGVQFTNSTTGTGTSNGSFIGIADDESLEIRNRENEDIKFYTNDTYRQRIISGNGALTTHATTGSGTSGFRVYKSNTSSTDQVFIAFSRSSSGPEDTGFSEGDIRTNLAGALTFQNTSDKRLKENIIDYENGYNKVKSLRTVEFEWKDKQKKEEIGKMVGFIAQEVQEVIPKCIGTFENGYLNMSQTELIPFLWSALRKTINKLETIENAIQNSNNFKQFKDNYNKII